MEVTDWLRVRGYGCTAKKACFIINCFVFVRVRVAFAKRKRVCARMRAGERSTKCRSRSVLRENGEVRADSGDLV